MTYVQYINCSKWKKIIGISLWIGATIGLCFLPYLSYGWFLDSNPVNCNNVWKEAEDGTPITTCQEKKNIGSATPILYPLASIYGQQIIILLVGFGLPISNFFCIWYAINRHYHIIELKCGVKPTTEVMK